MKIWKMFAFLFVKGIQLQQTELDISFGFYRSKYTTFN